jgi:hypothetical protein
MSGQTGFKTDILPLFTERDIMGMSRAFDLTDYTAVKAHARAIHDRIPRNRRRRHATAPTGGRDDGRAACVGMSAAVGAPRCER